MRNMVWRRDIDVINAGLDIICMTSFNEGTPVSLIEAQAAGKPVVSTRVGGIADIVIENETALLADVQDAELFCSHVQQLADNAGLRTRLGVHSARFVKERFAYQRLVNDMSQLYNELLNS